MNGDGSSLVCAVRGPIMLVALGVLLAAHQLDYYSFARTWPVLLILFGVLKLLERTTSGTGRSAPPGVNS